jgi:hypothetical protein
MAPIKTFLAGFGVLRAYHETELIAQYVDQYRGGAGE